MYFDGHLILLAHSPALNESVSLPCMDLPIFIRKKNTLFTVLLPKDM